MKKRKKQENEAPDSENYIEFVLPDDSVSSDETILKATPEPVEESLATLTSSTKLEDMPPAFRELALPKLPELPKQNRARLQMQTPNRLFFYWSLGANPFQKLNRALGSQTASYTLVLKLVDLRRDVEQIHPVDGEGTWWFDVEADGEYRAEIGFYAPNRPYVRAAFSNTVQTPRKSPSPRIDTEADWQVTSDRFARVLEVAGFTEDAFDVALTGDDIHSAEAATQAAFAEFIDDKTVDFGDVAADELRSALYLLASGAALEALRGRISPALFAILQSRRSSITAENAMTVLSERFEVEGDEIVSEEFGAAVFGASLINFPRRIRTKRTMPKLRPVSSYAGSASHIRVDEV
jgi:hypothetical protein